MQMVLQPYLANLFQDPAGALAMMDLGLQTEVFEALTRKEELGGPRDIWGNWDFSFSEAHRRGQTYNPWIDERVLGAINAPRRVLWPEGKPFALCITHDVDGLTGVTSLRERFRRCLALALSSSTEAGLLTQVRAAAGVCKGIVQGLRGVHGNFDFKELIEFEGSLDFRSTFYFLAEEKQQPHQYDSFYKFGDPVNWGGRLMAARKAIQEIHRAGWDIGVHGSYHSATKPGLLAQEKAQIEAVIGDVVTSCRQHYLHFETALTPDLQAEAGLKVDSTHGFNRSVGFRSGTAFPFPLYSESGRRSLPVLEIPQHVMDVSLFSDGALGYTEELAIAHVLDLMDKVERLGGLLTVSWHPENLGQRPMWRRVFEKVLLEAKRRNAYGCSMRQALERTLLLSPYP